MQGCMGNITILFSHCIKEKATLEEVQTKRSGPRHAIRQCGYQISLYQICIFDDNFFFEGIAQDFQTDTKSVQTSIHSKTANHKERFRITHHAKG